MFGMFSPTRDQEVQRLPESAASQNREFNPSWRRVSNGDPLF